jgi:hypothetical protein
MRITVRDESELPARDGEVRYIRSLCDPRFYIDGQTGDVVLRADGQKWQHSAYKVKGANGMRVGGQIGSAYADYKDYPYSHTAAA